jgi:4-hydroxy-tetrahydrodipicolinate reductase
MKFALIGNGTMGKLIAALAKEKGHVISVVVDDTDSALSSAELGEKLRGSDVAVDFTVAAAVRRNVESCLIAGVPLVEGTTGWEDGKEAIRALVEAHNGAFVFGSNFSVGVNLFFRITEFAADLVAKFEAYEAFIEERHHSRKKDAPSGTALKLKEIIGKHYLERFSIAATRAGDIPGTHTVGFDSAPDTIELTHTARSRDGFAKGALFAAEWIIGRTGFFEFSDVMDEMVQK